MKSYRHQNNEDNSKKKLVKKPQKYNRFMKLQLVFGLQCHHRKGQLSKGNVIETIQYIHVIVCCENHILTNLLIIEH